jgi:hypothetical protein
MKKALINTLAWLTGASRTLIGFLIPILADSTTRLLEGLLPIALEVVRSLAETPKSGEEKKREAVRQIQVLALNEGIRAETRAVNLSIELALAKLKEAGR